MTTAQVTRLRPLGMGELLDHAFRLYRRNFFTFIGIIAVVQIPLTLLTLLTSLFTVSDMMTAAEAYSYTGPAPESVWDILGPSFGWGAVLTLILGIISFVFVRGFATAALTRAVAGDYLGEPLGFIDAYRKVGKSWSRVILALLLGGLITIALVIYAIIPCIGWLTGWGMLLFFSNIVMQIVPAIVVLERQTPKNAIRRAWDLTRRRFWWVVGFVALLSLFSLVIVNGPTALVNWVLEYATRGLAAQNPQTALVISSVIESLTTLVMTLIYMPLQLAALTLLYFDFRVRTESFDLTWTAERALDADAALEDIVAQAPAPETASLITSNEFGNLFGLTIIFVVLVSVLSAIIGVFGALAGGLMGGF